MGFCVGTNPLNLQFSTATTSSRRDLLLGVQLKARPHDRTSDRTSLQAGLAFDNPVVS